MMFENKVSKLHATKSEPFRCEWKNIYYEVYISNEYKDKYDN